MIEKKDNVMTKAQICNKHIDLIIQTILEKGGFFLDQNQYYEFYEMRFAPKEVNDTISFLEKSGVLARETRDGRLFVRPLNLLKVINMYLE